MSFPLHPEMSPPNSLDVGDEDEAFLPDDSCRCPNIFSSADDLDDIADTRAPFACEHRCSEPFLTEVPDHLERLLVAFGNDFEKHERVQEPFLQECSDEISHGIAAAIGDELRNLEGLSSADNVTENDHIEHDLEKTNAGGEDALSPNEEKDPKCAAAHVEDAGAEDHQKSQNVYAHGDTPLNDDISLEETGIPV